MLAEKDALQVVLKGRTFGGAEQALYFLSFRVGFSPRGICFPIFFSNLYSPWVLGLRLIRLDRSFGALFVGIFWWIAIHVSGYAAFSRRNTAAPVNVNEVTVHTGDTGLGTNAFAISYDIPSDPWPARNSSTTSGKSCAYRYPLIAICPAGSGLACFSGTISASVMMPILRRASCESSAGAKSSAIPSSDGNAASVAFRVSITRCPRPARRPLRRDAHQRQYTVKRQPVRMLRHLRHGQRHGFDFQVHTRYPLFSHSSSRPEPPFRRRSGGTCFSSVILSGGA